MTQLIEKRILDKSDVESLDVDFQWVELLNRAMAEDSQTVVFARK